jgi:hypothetical protein
MRELFTDAEWEEFTKDAVEAYYDEEEEEEEELNRIYWEGV